MGYSFLLYGWLKITSELWLQYESGLFCYVGILLFFLLIYVPTASNYIYHFAECIVLLMKYFQL